MENNTDKLIQEQFDSLPTDIKEALGRIPWKDRVRDIAKRENLTPEQTESLETETMLILYGFEPADTYSSNLMSQVGLAEDQADRISDLVSNEIVADIEKQMEMIDALMPASASTTTQATPAAPKPKEETSYLNISPEILAKQIKIPEIASENLPETLPGQVAHDVPHAEAPVAASRAPVQTPQPTAPIPQAVPAVPADTAPQAPASIVEEKLSQVVSAPVQPSAPSYSPGKDPYREPIE